MLRGLRLQKARALADARELRRQIAEQEAREQAAELGMTEAQAGT